MKTDEILEEIATAAPGEIPVIVGELERLKAVAYARLTAPQPVRAEAATEDRNVDIDEAARLTGMSKSWLEKHGKDLGCRVKVGRRRLFSLRGLERWNRKNLTRTESGK